MGISKIFILAETNSCPRYTTIKIYKNLVPAIFVIFLIMYSRIRHALRFGVSLRLRHVKIKTALAGRFKILIFWRRRRDCLIPIFASALWAPFAT